MCPSYKLRNPQSAGGALRLPLAVALEVLNTVLQRVNELFEPTTAPHGNN